MKLIQPKSQLKWIEENKNYKLVLKEDLNCIIGEIIFYNLDNSYAWFAY